MYLYLDGGEEFSPDNGTNDPPTTSATHTYDQPDLENISTANIMPSIRGNEGVPPAYICKVAIGSTTLPARSFKAIHGGADDAIWQNAYAMEVNNIEKVGDMTVVKRPLDKLLVKIL